MIYAGYDSMRIGHVRTSERREIRADDVVAFADLTHDHHPVHVDEAYAARSRFGAQIAHGAYLVSTLLGLVELNPAYLQAFYGIEKLRFKAPAYFGDQVYAVSELTEVRPRPDGETAVIVVYSQLRNQRDELVLEGHFSLLAVSEASAMAV